MSQQEKIKVDEDSFTENQKDFVKKNPTKITAKI